MPHTKIINLYKSNLSKNNIVIVVGPDSQSQTNVLKYLRISGTNYVVTLELP